MPQTFDEEMNRSIWSKDNWSIGDVRETPIGTIEGKAKWPKLVKVRDYKDRYVLRSLQKEARIENPGFHWFNDAKQQAVIAWSLVDGMMVPSGYSITTSEHYVGKDGHTYPHWHPRTLNQIFVSKQMRRNGVGMKLLANHLSSEPNGRIWVESPKWETREMLQKLGYCEAAEHYEVWQMREGLTLWERKAAGRAVAARIPSRH